MKINKTLIILSLLLIFCISLGAVSAADDADMSLNDINDDSIGNTMDIKTDDANDNNINKLAEEYKTFDDLQEIISNTPEEVLFI